eukprot:CAMPEP_0206535902 /NCGR_PEP_ID=MMETSP0325_2-20121206/6423_1 /ASSEMBLY_ACC=CAM_ASM_000347 /TAXON_ID=2866 /ORGANISM="Crypthecodinium cohnii, Strain Seligo" /LENGTH=689 /DNA_ID=CAMNT_0054032997 /DNA_START=69 /DNA_END=2139 /DNA_ORIENTATION=+
MSVPNALPSNRAALMSGGSIDGAYEADAGGWSCFELDSVLAAQVSPRLLRASYVGYEDALVLKNCVHGMLWCCCLISFVFSMLWASDLLTLACTKPSIWPHALFQGCWKCLLDGIGFLIFSACFTDLVRMIAHFDDHRQRLLKKKQRLLKQTEDGCRGALAQSASFIEGLRSKVTRELGRQVETTIFQLFGEVLPTLYEVRQRSGAKVADVDALVQEFVELIYVSLHEDIRNPVEAMRDRMHFDHAGVFEETADEPAMPDLEANQGYGSFATTSLGFRPLPAELTLTRAERMWQFWFDRVYEPIYDVGVLAPSPDPGINGALQRLQNPAANLGDKERTLPVAGVIAQCLLRPADEFMAMERFMKLKLQEQVRKNSNIPERSRRFGFCSPVPPRATQTWCVSLCLCRTFVVPLQFCCVCLCPSRGRNCLARGLTYDPPKLLRLGPFWVQIHTKLQERLLTGLCLSVIFLGVYIYYACTEYQSWSQVCIGSQLSECWLELARKSVAAVSLSLYCLAVVQLLWNIDRLDAVMDTIVTIWHLEEIRGAVQGFNHYMRFLDRDSNFLKVVLDRLSLRARVVETYSRRFCFNRRLPVDIHMVALKAAIGCLEEVDKKFLPAQAWIELELSEQERLTKDATEMVDLKIAELEEIAESPHDMAEHDESLTPAGSSDQPNLPGRDISYNSVNMESFAP